MEGVMSDPKDMILSVVRQLLNQANVILQLHDRVTKLESLCEVVESGNPPSFVKKDGECCSKCGSTKIVKYWWDEDGWYCADCWANIKKEVR